MSELVTSATDILVPLLAGGAGAAVNEIAKQSGSGFYRVAAAIITKVRLRITSSGPVDKAQLHAVLSEGVADGDITLEELRALVQYSQQLSIHNDLRNSKIKKSIVGGVVNGNVQL